ncbi:MAG: tRNA (N(6)-L-threonylcarbamoyladenosine(37)-C(2))-methylthiotransferase MtaB [Clostridia bacterium]|nr:tRNA (N(6)-L-threonylcarbamoyladenosine(37)-C(2))-methylthiotransferase MtaB [Clostridia bacterium]
MPNNERKVRAAIYTLGCKVNSYESLAISEELSKNSVEICDPSEKVDICIINTCAVTAEAERKSRQIIRRMTSVSPDVYVIVTGCSAQLDPERILKIKGVSAVCGNREKMKVAELAIEHAKKLRNESEKQNINGSDGIICSCELENAPFEKMSISSSERTRAVLKIEDGCESKCAYCIIPKLRGKIRSKAPEAVIEEAKILSENGYREIVLTGIEVSAYGKDLGRRDGLISLIEELGRIEKIKRIRLGSLDPSAISEDFIDRASKIPSFAPHFHLSLQSGCNNTLFSMKRRYNVDMVKNKIDYIRSKMPDAMFTSDIIVGFPGETDADFEETRKFLASLDLLSFHIFAYSKRPGTPAADMPNQVAPDVKSARLKVLEALRAEMTEKILNEHIGKTLEIIVEEYKEAIGAIGHTANFIEVAVEGTDESIEDLHGRIITVKAERQENGIILGRIV